MRRIIIGVTIDDSLQFHSGLPEALVRDGWDVHIVTTPGRRSEQLRNVHGVTVHELVMDREPCLRRDVHALLRWLVLMRRIAPDSTFIGTPKAALLGNLAAWCFACLVEFMCFMASEWRPRAGSCVRY